MSEYTNILVGIDGSKQSEMAFKKAVNIAKRNQATLNLLSVVNGTKDSSSGTVTYGFIDRSMYDKATKKLTDELAKLKKQAEDAGLTKVNTDVLIGNAKVELTTGYVKKNKIDMIVVGASGLNVVGRMIVGSTTAYVVRQAPCDVVVVKTDDANKPIKIDTSSYPTI